MCQFLLNNESGRQPQSAWVSPGLLGHITLSALQPFNAFFTPTPPLDILAEISVQVPKEVIQTTFNVHKSQ